MEQSKSEVLRYLGFSNQELSQELNNLIDECMAMMHEEVKPRHVCRTFGIDFKKTGIEVIGSILVLQGDDILSHLAGCSNVVLLAATLGVTADTLIRRYEGVDITRALILDACATQYIEEYCDHVEEELRNDATKCKLKLTPRFSPGYGDLPLNIQPEILAALDAEKRIGLTCTGNLILLPRKSVTALMGQGEHAIQSRKNCGNCKSCSKRDTCSFKRTQS